MNNEFMLTDDNSLELSLTNAVQSYSSLVPKTDEERITFFNAVNNPEKRLKDMVNMEIALVHVYAERCEFINRESGEATPGIRMVFIDDEGHSYQAASKGIFSSTQKLFQIMGMPTNWSCPVIIRPRQVSKGVNQNVLVFEVVGLKR